MSHRTSRDRHATQPVPEDAARGVCLFGAALNTANLGVSALGLSVLRGIEEHTPSSDVTLFDFGRGMRPLDLRLNGQDHAFRVTQCGAYLTKRVYRPESLTNIRLSVRLGGLGNPGARALRRADAVLDISGGDSFTDMYGPFRFRSIAMPKEIALQMKKPLVLLPQTYGPFRTPEARRSAEAIVRGAAMAFARDERSYDILIELLGDDFDVKRHCTGVDVAFALPTVRPSDEALGAAGQWLEDRAPIAGVNVSGLLLNQPDTARERYRLKADYRAVIVQFVRRLLKDSDARVLLIPHVVTPAGHYESDIAACDAVAAEVADSSNRLFVCPALQDPREVKWVIAQCAWFCGTRMHSTIAALSSGVPAAAIAYSEKTLGVFETCGQGDHVADPRALDTGEVVDRLWTAWRERDAAQATLNEELPAVKARAAEQMAQIMGVVSGAR